MKIEEEFKRTANPLRAKHSLRFFKTGVGEYGHGDIFYGQSVPEVRQIAKKFKDLSLAKIKNLLYSPYHEERQCAFMILLDQFERVSKKKQKELFRFYVKHIEQGNNWDLVDLFAPKIAGRFLFDKKRDLLYRFAVSKNLWKRRVAVIATFYFIHQDDFQDTLKISEILLQDKEDLIHKAVGWMLREVGKRSLSTEEAFLKKNYKIMPRVMLRYAIEKFPVAKKRQYLKR